MRHPLLLIAIPLALAALSCANRDQERITQETGQTIKDFRPVRYHRSGGLIGADERITISADGAIQTTGRTLGNRAGRLSEFQMMQLVRLFDGWDKLASKYPAPPGSADHFITEIAWGEKTVTAADGPDLPDQFSRIRERLQAMTHDLPKAETRPAF